MEREKFEDSWKNAFDKAEVGPSDKVWTNIELDLEKAKGGDLKKRLMFYQMLAAASVVFAMALGGVGFYYAGNHQFSGDNLALKAPAGIEKTLSPSAEHESSNIADPLKNNTDLKKNNTDPLTTTSNTTEITRFKTNDNFADQQSTDNNEPAQPLLLTIDDKDLPPFYQAKKIDLTIPDKTAGVDPVEAMLNRLEQREKEVSGAQRKKETDTNKSENLWTSIGFAAGSFTTVHSSVSNTTQNSILALNAPMVDEEAKASGYSYSIGVNVGTRIAERWVFQGGINYLTHSSEYTAHNAVAASSSFKSFKPASTNELVKADYQDLSEKIVYTAPYNVNNSLRYLSIPMQAGYLLVNKSFGLQLNAGVATDLFLQNTVNGEGNNLDNTTQSGGEDSPYRSVNLSGLLGTEVSYRFGDHYRVALNPGIRYPFNTIYKSELGVQASPFTFDVGLRFRYIFH